MLRRLSQRGVERPVGNRVAERAGAGEEVGDIGVEPEIAAVRPPEAEAAAAGLVGEHAGDGLVDAVPQMSRSCQREIDGELRRNRSAAWRARRSARCSRRDSGRARQRGRGRRSSASGPTARVTRAVPGRRPSSTRCVERQGLAGRERRSGSGAPAPGRWREPAGSGALRQHRAVRRGDDRRRRRSSPTARARSIGTSKREPRPWSARVSDCAVSLGAQHGAGRSVRLQRRPVRRGPRHG